MFITFTLLFFMTIVGILSNFIPLFQINFYEKISINELSESDDETEIINSADYYEDSENSSHLSTESEEDLSNDRKSEDWVSLNTK